MNGPRRIFVDFNNRVKRPDDGEYYRVSLGELEGLDVGSRVLATDLEDVELPVLITAIFHTEGTAIVKISQTHEFPAVLVPMSGPPQVETSEVRTRSMDSLGEPAPA